MPLDPIKSLTVSQFKYNFLFINLFIFYRWVWCTSSWWGSCCFEGWSWSSSCSCQEAKKTFNPDALANAFQSVLRQNLPASEGEDNEDNSEEEKESEPVPILAKSKAIEDLEEAQIDYRARKILKAQIRSTQESIHFPLLMHPKPSISRDLCVNWLLGVSFNFSTPFKLPNSKRTRKRGSRGRRNWLKLSVICQSWEKTLQLSH